jgi:hypothetical protein
MANEMEICENLCLIPTFANSFMPVVQILNYVPLNACAWSLRRTALGQDGGRGTPNRHHGANVRHFIHDEPKRLQYADVNQPVQRPTMSRP